MQRPAAPHVATFAASLAKFAKAVVIVSLAVSTFPNLPNAEGVPIERNAVIGSKVAHVVQTMVALVRAYGYTCDSVTTAQKWVFSLGLTLVCNHGAYEYEISQPGGKWRVVAK